MGCRGDERVESVSSDINYALEPLPIPKGGHERRYHFVVVLRGRNYRSSCRGILVLPAVSGGHYGAVPRGVFAMVSVASVFGGH